MNHRVQCLAAALLLAGCSTPPATTQPVQGPLANPHLAPRPPGVPVIGNDDPSAIKLQDICGALLAYYAIHQQLPAQFDQLKEVADMADGPVDLTCPGSTKPYVYTRDGIYLQDREQWVVMYEPEPLHHGFREAITINQPRRGEAVQTKVVPLPEQFFLLHPPGSAPEKPLNFAVPPSGTESKTTLKLR